MAFVWALLMLSIMGIVIGMPKPFVDTSINEYITERLCWSKEACKEEFQAVFICRCPEYSYCQSPGRYYKAYCSIVQTGYVWAQHMKQNSTDS